MFPMFRNLITAMALLLLAAPASAVTLEPFDAATNHPDLVAYRDKLKAAAGTRDFDKLKPFLSPDIQLSFGGHYGLAEAAEMFRDNPELWDTLADVLNNGGGFQETGESDQQYFIAPYTFFAEPPDGDVFETLVLKGESIKIHKQPREDSEVLAELSHEVVAADLGEPSPDDDWVRIKLPEGGSGYVKWAQAVSPVDYRAGFEKKDGTWRMIFFLAGD